MIKTWQQRCEEHPDHEGIVSGRMIRARMQEEIDELREALEAGHPQTVIQRLLRERQIFMEAGQRDTETIDKLREENRTLAEAHFSQGLTICSLQEQLDEVEELREALKAGLEEVEGLRQTMNTTLGLLKEVKHTAPIPQEQACSHCSHPMYAGIRCAQCGRWTGEDDADR